MDQNCINFSCIKIIIIYEIQQSILLIITIQKKMSSNHELTMKEQIQLDQLIKQIKKLYQQLKNCEHQPIQSTIIWSLKPKCQEAINILTKNLLSSEYTMKRAWVCQVKQKIQEISAKLQKNQKTKTNIGSGGRIHDLNSKLSYTQEDLKAQFGSSAVEQLNSPFKQEKKMETREEKKPIQNHRVAQKLYEENRKNEKVQQSSIFESSRKILRSIAMQEMKSINLKYKTQELDQILHRLEANKQVMNAMQSMIIQQGNNIDVVQKNIEKAYENVQQANVQLTEAEQNQLKYISTVSKAYRSTASMFWGAVTWPFRKFFNIFKHK